MAGVALRFDLQGVTSRSSSGVRTGRAGILVVRKIASATKKEAPNEGIEPGSHVIFVDNDSPNKPVMASIHHPRGLGFTQWKTKNPITHGIAALTRNPSLTQ